MSYRILLPSRSALGAAILFALTPLLLKAEKTHTLYMSVSLTQDFTIGKRVTSESGIYVSEDRTTARHIGFHHPRMDKGSYDPRDPDILYFASLNGALGTRDGGKTWKILTSWNMTEGKDIKVDPHNPDTVYLALPDGIAISRNSGESWKYADAGIERKYTQSLAPFSNRENHILAGTELGIYRSTDGAASWHRVLPTTATVNHVEQSPHDPEVFIAATQADGAWISRDSGKTWTQVQAPAAGQAFHYARFHPNDPEVITLSGWGAGLRISSDGGKTWSACESVPGINVWSHAHDPDFPNRLYACIYRDTVYVSDDLGQSWKPFLFEGATVWGYLFVPNTSE